MALEYTPALYNGSAVLELPQPVYQCKIIDTVKSEKHIVPMKGGGKSYGPTFEPVQIVVTGGIGRHEGTQTVTEDEQFAVYSELREYLRALTDVDAAEFFPFYSPESDADVRKFKRVFVEAFDIDLGDQNRTEWAWELKLRADDPVIYSTAPGE